VHELCAAAEGPSQPQLDSTAASGDSCESEDGIAILKARAEAGMCE
jgi:hypothetical protein